MWTLVVAVILPILGSEATTVRSLLEADNQRDAVLDIVVTHHDPKWRVMFIADQTGAMFARPPKAANGKQLRVGTRLRVRGTSHPATAPFNASMAVEHYEVLGVGPPPPSQRLADCDAPYLPNDAQWVELDATLTQAFVGPTHVRAFGTWCGRPFDTYVVGVGSPDAELVRSWLRTPVRLEGNFLLRFPDLRPGLAVASSSRVEPLLASSVSPRDALVEWDLCMSEPKAPALVDGVVGSRLDGGAFVCAWETLCCQLLRSDADMDLVAGELLRVELEVVGEREVTFVERRGFSERPRVALREELPTDGPRWVSVSGVPVDLDDDPSTSELDVDGDVIVLDVFDKEDDILASLLSGAARVRVDGVFDPLDSTGAVLHVDASSDVRVLEVAPSWPLNLLWGFAVLGSAALVGGVMLARLRRARARADALQVQTVAALERLDVAAVLVDLDGVIMGANSSMLELSGGSSSAQALGPLLDGVDPSGVLRSWVENPERAGRTLRVEREAAPGRLIAALDDVVGPAGDATSRLLLVRDVDAALRDVAPKVQATRISAIAELAGGAVHDINNLLGVVMMNLDSLEFDPEQRDLYIRDASVAVTRASKISRNLLSVARTKDIEATRTDVVATLAELTGGFGAVLGSRIRCEFDCAESSLHAWVNTTMLEQVVMNLLVNARDAMPDGGTIRVSVRRETKCELAIRVADEGSGVCPEVAKRMFDAFFTTKAEGQGTGIGLSTARDIARMHGGELELESSSNTGSTFVLRLPVDLGDGEVPGPPARQPTVC